MASLPTAPLRLRPAVVALALAAGVLTVPVAAAGPAAAAPCLPIPGLPCIFPPAATSEVAFTGTPRIGETVTAQPPTWDQGDLTVTYQWLRDGEDIDGATAAAYRLGSADFGETISVRVTGTNPTAISGSADSGPIEPLKGGPITASGKPVVTGSPTVGGTLTGTSGRWGEPEPTFAYQWYRNRPDGTSQPIAGATTTTYSPVLADSGRRLALLVTAERVGYEKGVAVSNVVQVPRAASATRLSLPRARVRATQAPSVRVVLTSSVGVAPTGIVTVFDGTRRVRSVRFTAASAAMTIVLPRQTKGTHRLTARYGGDGTHAPSVSGAQVLTVVR